MGLAASRPLLTRTLSISFVGSDNVTKPGYAKITQTDYYYMV